LNTDRAIGSKLGSNTPQCISSFSITQDEASIFMATSGVGISTCAMINC